MSYDTHCSSCGMPYSDFAREGAKSCECHKMAAQAVRDFVFDKPALSASPVAQEPVARLCGYCKTWNSKPCGEQCYLQPSDPVWTSPPATPAGMGCDYPSCGCDFDSICRTRMAILSGGGPDAKPDGYRFRHKYSNREWEWSNEKPEGPSIHLFDVEACYTRPIRSAGLGTDEIARAISAPLWLRPVDGDTYEIAGIDVATNAILALLSRDKS